MKIIFLDIDGVLNYHDFLVEERKSRTKADGKLFSIKDNETWEDMLSPSRVARLEALVQRTGASVVISSSWRHAHPWPRIHGFLRKNGFTGKVIGATPTDIRTKFSQSVERGEEIASWLDTWAAFGDKSNPVESFIIFDDTHVGGEVDERVIYTSLHTGLLDEHVEAAIKLFEVPFRHKKKSLIIPKKNKRR